MAAPSYAYISKKLALQSTGGQVDHYLAKIHVNEATHLDLFYLDEIIAVGNPSEEEGWAGVVYPTSPNYQFHNILRHGTMRHQGSGVVLNDGGLNTLGFAEILSDDLKWANNVRFSAYHKSSYYDDTVEYGIQYRKVGTLTWNEWKVYTPLLSGDDVTADRLFDPSLAPGDNLEVRAFITNNEGTYVETSTTIITLLDYVYEVDFYYRALGACNTSGQVNLSVFMFGDDIPRLDTDVTTSDTNTGIYLYKNVNMTTPADSGWYIGQAGDKSFFVDIDGQVKRYEECTIAPPSITLAVEQDGVSLTLQVQATIQSALAYDVVVEGRIDVDPLYATPNGVEFELTIPAGLTTGMTDPDEFNFTKDPSFTYYWQNVFSTPSGFVFIKQMPI